MPTRLSWLALGCGAYLAFAVASLPAGAVYRWFANDQLRLSGIEGTIWSGRAAFGSIPRLPLSDLRWNLSAWPLLLGRVSGEFEARLAEGFVSGRVTASGNTVRFRDLRASTSLQTLKTLLPIGDTTGNVSAALQTLELVDQWPTTVAGRLSIGQLETAPLMATAGAGFVAIGSFELTFTDTGGQGVEATIHDTGGPLEVNGRLSLGLDRSYLLDGTVRPRPDASELLLQGLSFMTGDPDAEGLRHFEFPGTL
jgi:general secretion pathway protein N